METLRQSTVGNLLLRYCEPEDFDLLGPHLKRVHYGLREAIYRKNQPIETIYFPEGGVASIVAEQEANDLVEIGLYGYEGMSGTPVVLGAESTPQASMIQMDGSSGLAMPADVLVEACDRSASLRKLLLRYAQCMNVQAAATASANSNFALPERLARWLLMCHDRVDSDKLELTHEFMSMMLAVRRSSVTVTLHVLEGTRAIKGTRGIVTVLDRERLEEIAGDSYGEPETEYRRLIGPFGRGRNGLHAVA